MRGDTRVFDDGCARAQPEAKSAGREAVTGLQLGGLTLEPQDVEVVTKVRVWEWDKWRGLGAVCRARQELFQRL